MPNIPDQIDRYTRSRTAGKRLYLALKIKGISRTRKGLFSDEEWLTRNLPKTAKSLSAWFEDGVPVYSKGKNIRPIEAIAEYFRTDRQYFTDEGKISDEDFLDKIINTPTLSELPPGNAPENPPADIGHSFPEPSEPKPLSAEFSGLPELLERISESARGKEKPFAFFRSILWKKIRSDISNFAESDFIEITSIHQMPLVWIACHENMEKSMLISSYANVKQWVNHPVAKESFEKEAELVSRGIRIRRVYIHDTTEELRLLLASENVRVQMRGKVELRFISHSELRNFYYIKDIMASMEVIDAGLIDERWLFLAFLDTARNPVKLKICWDPAKVDEYKIFLNELWHGAKTAEEAGSEKWEAL